MTNDIDNIKIFDVGGRIWVYNTALIIHKGDKHFADDAVFKSKFLLMGLPLLDKKKSKA